MVWAQMDGAAVSITGPSGSGLTCLPTLHNLMPTDKWMARSAGCGRGEAAGGETWTVHRARIQNPSHQRFCKGGGSLALRMENIYIKKSMASFKS